MSDYRIDKYKNISFSQLRSKKYDFMRKFRDKHKTAWKVYDYVGRSQELHNDFKSIYNSRCAYCGADYSFFNRYNFDIDHYIPQDSKYKKQFLHGISNLVYSCRRCNEKKLAYWCASTNNSILLHPDNDNYPKIFYRDSSFKICIQNEYLHNSEVIEFYNELELGSNEKRLLYLIMVLTDYLDEKPASSKENKARQILSFAKDRFNSQNFN